MKDYLREIVERAAPPARVNVMREYLQARILETLQEKGVWTSLAFRGGTSLRFLYRLPRFSEGLDFTLERPSPEFDFLALIAAVRTRLGKEGYQTEAKANTKRAVNKAFIRFLGLEQEMGFSVRPHKAFSVKVEVDTRPPAGAGLAVTTIRRYATLRLAHHDKPSLLAGKVAALLCRDWIKGRDVYDLVWYLSDPEWPDPNKLLLQNALEQSGLPEPATKAHDWQGSLVHRLAETPWDGVRSDVERFLERPADIWMVEKKAVLDVLAQRARIV